MTEPPCIKKFRASLIKVIPRFPNNRASLLHMQQKQIPELLIDYVNWRSRYVGQRPRTVSIEPAAQSDPRWTSHAAAVKAFLDKVRRGDDLTPRLSIEPHTKGYTPAARAPNAPPVDRWSDKDFVLNVMGYHHYKARKRGNAVAKAEGPVTLKDQSILGNTDKVKNRQHPVFSRVLEQF